MKELLSHIKEEIKIRVETQQEKQKLYTGSLKRHPGQTIYQVDLRTQTISKADFDESAIIFETGEAERKITRKENHWYCAALNEKNAFKKFNYMAKQVFEKLNPSL